MVRKATAEKKNQGLLNKISEQELFIARLEKEKIDLQNQLDAANTKLAESEKKRKFDRKRLGELQS